MKSQQPNTYYDSLLVRLRDRRYADAYLNSVLDDQDDDLPGRFRLAMSDVAAAQWPIHS